MPYCTECGEEVGSEDVYCEACGASIESSESQSSQDSGPTENASAEQDIETATRPDGFTAAHALKAGGFALIPAFGAYMLVSVAAYDPIPAVLFIGIPVFAYLIYRRPGTKSMASGMFFWLSVESFLAPIAALFYTASYSAAETTTAAEEAGAAIGGGIVTIMAFVIGVPLGLVFYLLSRRLEPESG